MPTKLKIKKGDKVVVLAGRDKGKSGEVLGVFPTEKRALVQGVNIVKRHQRQSAQTEGGIIALSCIPFHAAGPSHSSSLSALVSLCSHHSGLHSPHRYCPPRPTTTGWMIGG